MGLYPLTKRTRARQQNELVFGAMVTGTGEVIVFDASRPLATARLLVRDVGFLAA